MRSIVSMITIFVLTLTISADAGSLHKTPVTKLIDHSATLGLTDSQVKKLRIIEDTAAQKMTEARLQADIRLTEIEKFTTDWTNMNGTAVRSLLKEYYEFLSQYKYAELNAIIQARSILDYNQLTRFQQLVSIESLILRMEDDLALR